MNNRTVIAYIWASLAALVISICCFGIASINDKFVYGGIAALVVTFIIGVVFAIHKCLDKMVQSGVVAKHCCCVPQDSELTCCNVCMLKLFCLKRDSLYSSSERQSRDRSRRRTRNDESQSYLNESFEEDVDTRVRLRAMEAEFQRLFTQYSYSESEIIGFTDRTRSHWELLTSDYRILCTWLNQGQQPPERQIMRMRNDLQAIYRKFKQEMNRHLNVRSRDIDDESLARILGNDPQFNLSRREQILPPDGTNQQTVSLPPLPAYEKENPNPLPVYMIPDPGPNMGCDMSLRRAYSEEVVRPIQNSISNQSMPSSSRSEGVPLTGIGAASSMDSVVLSATALNNPTAMDCVTLSTTTLNNPTASFSPEHPPAYCASCHHSLNVSLEERGAPPPYEEAASSQV